MATNPPIANPPQPNPPEPDSFLSAEWTLKALRYLASHKAAVVSIAAAIALPILGFLFFYPASPDSHPSQAITRTVELKSAKVRVQARMPGNRLEDDAASILEVDLFNDSDKTIDQSAIHLSAPGFSLADNPATFSTNQTSLPCTDASGNPLKAIPAHGSCRFDIHLSPACRSGTYGITVFADWSAAGLHGNTAILLPPVTIDRSWGAARFARAGRRINGIVKDLAVPIMLAILGALFAAWQGGLEASRRRTEQKAEDDRADRDREREQNRIEAERNLDQERAEREQTREEERLKAEKEQSERQEVGRLLLTRILDLARKHYLPFVSQAKSLLSEAEKNRGSAADADFEKLFYHLLLLLKHLEVFRLTEGGIFFKRRDGEMALTAAWFLLKTTSYRGLGGDQAVATAMTAVERNWDYAAYKAALPAPSIQALWTSFQTWRKVPESPVGGSESFWHILGIVDAFQAIASFEADLALQYWYEKERDPKDKLFFLPGKTIVYRKERLDPQNMAETLAARLKALYQREVQINLIP